VKRKNREYDRECQQRAVQCNTKWRILIREQKSTRSSAKCNERCEMTKGDP
jgi:hypothetical protein